MMASSTSSSTILHGLTIEYFTFCGRAQPLYLFLEDAGIPYTKIDSSSFQKQRADLTLYPFNQMPIVRLQDGTRLAQLDAILRFFARTIPGHLPTDPDELLKVDMLACACEDFTHTYQAAVWSSDHAEDLLLFLHKSVPRFFAQISQLLLPPSQSASASSPWNGTFVISCPEPTHPEYFLLHLIHCVLRLQPSALDSDSDSDSTSTDKDKDKEATSLACAPLRAWYDRMSARERVKSYLEDSERCPRQLNYLKTAEERML